VEIQVCLIWGNKIPGYVWKSMNSDDVMGLHNDRMYDLLCGLLIVIRNSINTPVFHE